jgi:hypothetical protein
MPDAAALHKFVHKRFREVFGEPSSSLGRDDHWSLPISGLDLAAINVLVNGTSSESPAVWVFDPHIQHDGVMRVAIKDEATLEDTINQILERVKRANRKYAAG